MFPRLFCHRITQVRKFSFKRPPPDYIFKRPVVQSDIDGSKIKQFPKYDVENEKWFDDNEEPPWRCSRPKGNYGNSLYEPQENTYNDRQD